MSSKVRLDDLAWDQDEMDQDFLTDGQAPRQKMKTTKTKRKRSDSELYLQQRSLKRQANEHFERH